MDEGWAQCAPKPGFPTGNWAYHRSNADGSVSPVVDESIFPNMTGLVSTIHSLGLRAGWYLNDCLSYCWELGDTCPDDICNPGDVQAWFDFGFDSLKVDGCSAQRNVTYWSQLLNATGRAVILENCHNGPNPVLPIADGGCPWYHTYRVSTDIRNTYGSFIENAQQVLPFLTGGMHGPGCWAYPDMLMVGVNGDINGRSFPPSQTEQRSHFGLWCVLSAPITLSLDLRNASAVDAAWPVISNVDAVGVNQAWAGAPGGLYAAAAANVTLQHCTPDWDGDRNCTLPLWQAFYKPLPQGAVAAFTVNHGFAATDASVRFASIPSLPCSGSCEYCVYDVWAQAAMGQFSNVYSVPALASHDSVFLIISPPDGSGACPAVTW